MGLLDALFGVHKLPEPNVENLFKLSPAAVTMEEAMGVKASGKAGICFRAFDTKNFDEVRNDITSILSNSDFKEHYRILKDDYDFTWIALDRPLLEDLVAGVHMVSQLLIEGGFGKYILCALFEFKKDWRTLYWVYGYRRGKFYPFVPLENNERDFQLEYRLRTLVLEELPVESLDYWYPIWGVPF